ncbi:hypothetical protein [[Kitasatospora] papulosa]|uniref:hypothetical protein n=1 Tax=[Kitasatospora] papulosa TaxID=1464011 RepID=UPI0037F14316
MKSVKFYLPIQDAGGKMQDKANNHVNLLVTKLGDLHLEAGEPSMRAVASRTGGVVSHSTVHQALSGKRIPRWGSLELIIEALGGEPKEFQSLWRGVRLHARGHEKETLRPNSSPSTYRFKLESVESFGRDAKDFLILEQMCRVKERDGVAAAAAFLGAKIGVAWNSALMGEYLSLLEDSDQRVKISEIMPHLRRIEMKSASAAHAVAEAFDLIEEYGEAARHEKVALRLDPNNGGYAWYVGSYLSSHGVDEEAHAYYALAHSLKPGDVDVAESYITSLIHRSEFPEAVSVAQKAPISTANHVVIQSLTGKAFALQGLFLEAEGLLKSMSERFADDDRTLAQVLVALGKPGEALELLAARWKKHRGDFMTGLLYIEMLRESEYDDLAEEVVAELAERLKRKEGFMAP